MKRPELYHRTVDILVQAYFNDTLEHYNCRACAVGNIIAANMGIKLMRGGWSVLKHCVYPENFEVHVDMHDSGIWYDAIRDGEILNDKITKLIKRQIQSTGYSFKEIAKIEVAFENCNEGNTEEDFMFNGLMAVIEVLDQIHENTDTEISQSSKSKFTRNSLTPIIH